MVNIAKEEASKKKKQKQSKERTSLWIIIINHLALYCLGWLLCGQSHMSNISSSTIRTHLKSPSLDGIPSFLLTHTLNLNQAFGSLFPTFRQVLVFNLTDWQSSSAGFKSSPDVIGLTAPFPVEDSSLGGTLDATGDGVVKLEGFELGGCVGGVLELEGDGGVGEGFACHPADGLHVEAFVSVARELAVLFIMLVLLFFPLFLSFSFHRIRFCRLQI